MAAKKLTANAIATYEFAHFLVIRRASKQGNDGKPVASFGYVLPVTLYRPVPVPAKPFGRAGKRARLGIIGRSVEGDDREVLPLSISTSAAGGRSHYNGTKKVSVLPA